MLDTIEELAAHACKQIFASPELTLMSPESFAKATSQIARHFGWGARFDAEEVGHWLATQNTVSPKDMALLYCAAQHLADFRGETLLTTKSAALPNSPDFVASLLHFRDWMTHSGYSKGTVSTRVSLAKPFLIWAEGGPALGFRQIGCAEIARFCCSERFDGKEPGGVRDELQQLRFFVSWCVEAGYIADPNAKLAIPSIFMPRKRAVTVLSQEEIDCVLGDYRGCPTNLRNRAAFCLALFCGLRKSDIHGLRLCDVDFEAHRLKITQKKTKTPFETYMTPVAENALLDYILKERDNSAETDMVFLKSAKNEPMETPAFDPSRRYKAAGLKPESSGMHIMRRTFASRLLSKGASLQTISVSLGHVDAGCVNRYLSADGERLKMCALSIEGLPAFDPWGIEI